MSGTIPDENGLEPISDRKIPKRVRQAIDARMSGRAGNWKAAAALVGLSPEHLSRMLSKDHVRVFYERRARETLREIGPEAVAVLRDLVTNGKTERTRLAALEQTFRLLGMFPRNDAPNVNINVSPGYVIDLKGAGGPVIEGHAHDVGPLDARQLPPAGGPAEDVDGDDDGAGE